MIGINRGAGPRTVLPAALLILTASVLACGPQAPIQTASPRPSARPVPQVDVLIMPVGQKTRDELPHWTTENHRLVYAYFDIFMRHRFFRNTSSRIIVADDDFETEALELELQPLRNGNGRDSDWRTYVPVAGKVYHGDRAPDYVLMFDDLRFMIHGGGGARQTYDVPGSGKVEVDLAYVLWDNNNQEVAAMGHLHEEAYTTTPHASSELFKGIFEKMAREIVRSSPLVQ